MIPTADINYNTTINRVFTDNRISFREIACRNGILYLCCTPLGQTFNLRLENNQSIKIWSFIGTSTIENTDNKHEWKNDSDLYPVGGIEITSDGDLSFYMTDFLILDEATNKYRIKNLINSYVKMIPHILSRSFEL